MNEINAVITSNFNIKTINKNDVFILYILTL